MRNEFQVRSLYIFLDKVLYGIVLEHHIGWIVSLNLF